MLFCAESDPLLALSLREGAGATLYRLLEGEVAEWSKAPVSKTGILTRYRGFESLPLRPLGNEDIGSPATRARRVR